MRWIYVEDNVFQRVRNVELGERSVYVLNGFSFRI